MTARAESAAATRARIMQAAADAMRVRFRPDIRLDDIAAAAGVSVQSIMRIFGSRGALLDAVTEVAVGDVAAEFVGVEPGDVEAIVRAYYRHYEKAGDLVVRNIVDEAEPGIRAFVARGRSAHRAGVERLFAPSLDATPAEQRRMTVDALVCTLDVYVWKLLRRDMKRSLPTARATVVAMIRAILEAE